MTAEQTTQNRAVAEPRPIIRWLSIDFDCSDPVELAQFYSRGLGLPVLYTSDDFVLLGTGAGGPGLGFIRILDYRRPSWPESVVAKQAHLEFGVDDLDSAQAWMGELGAVLTAFQPDISHRRVMLDPAGHPFCLTTHGV
ncbi:VOC family protein [Nocardia sp. bgisy118]